MIGPFRFHTFHLDRSSTLDITWHDHGILRMATNDAGPRARQGDGVLSDASPGPTMRGISIVILRIYS